MPEKHEHAHQRLHVDAGLIAQLREGYAALSEGGPKLLARGRLPGWGRRARLRLQERKGIPRRLPGRALKNIHRIILTHNALQLPTLAELE